MKKYKAIFFDWDGTAVPSRKAPVDQVVACMKPLLQQGVNLIVVSGTTIENIADGRLHESFTREEQKHLFLGLGRGAYDMAFDDCGSPYFLTDRTPELKELLAVHEAVFAVHQKLLGEYGISTDVVFSRPNYCKIDLMVEHNRGDQLFFQENELEAVNQLLTNHGFSEGLLGMVHLAEQIGKEHGLSIQATTDAKFLEAGISSKSDNVNGILEYLNQTYGIEAKECAFLGDEYVGMDEGLYGSDSYMKTKNTEDGDFFDVSDVAGVRPVGVEVIGGGVEAFLSFLRSQE